MRINFVSVTKHILASWLTEIVKKTDEKYRSEKRNLLFWLKIQHTKL
jgi:hypothetical protein